MSLAQTATEGVRLKTLEALRDRLASDLDGCESMRDVAALSQRLMDVLGQIDDLGGGKDEKPRETGLSDFEKRLRDRESRASGSRRSKSS